MLQFSGLRALRCGAMRLRLENSGGAVMLQHDLVFLLYFFTKQTHEYSQLSIMRDGAAGFWQVPPYPLKMS